MRSTGASSQIDFEVKSEGTRRKYERLRDAVKEHLIDADCGHSIPDECCRVCQLKVLVYYDDYAGGSK